MESAWVVQAKPIEVVAVSGIEHAHRFLANRCYVPNRTAAAARIGPSVSVGGAAETFSLAS